jgi:L-ascorbate metabolism protein UlaG (beta-lactamase superfamily)
MSPDGREVSITAVPAVHGPESLREALGPVIGFVISSPGDRTIYISGDNASIEPVHEVAARFPDIAVAVLFAGGPSFEVFDGVYLAFSDEMAVAAAEILENATIFPIHADSWEHFSQTTESMKQLAADHGIGERVIALAPGQMVTV